MALDDGGLAEAGFDHVRVDRPLGEIVHRADRFGLRLEDADELLPDDVAFFLRLRHAAQPLQKAGARINAAEIQRA